MSRRRKLIIAALVTLGIIAAIYLFLHFGQHAAPPPTGGGGSSGGGSSTSGGSGSGSGTPPPHNTHRGTGWAETRGEGRHFGIEKKEGEI